MSENPYESPETPGSPPNKAGGSRFTLLSLLAVIGIAGLIVACLLPNVRGVREAGRRMSCMNNLRQIAIALHNYEDEFGCLPPAYTVDAAGKPLHSWRTLILPFAEQKALYDKIDLSKPWDDPANHAAYEMNLPMYQCPSGHPPKGHTTYLAVACPGGCFLPAESRKLADITDGTERTLMVIEVPVERAVHWMSPSDASEKEILNAVASSKRPHPGGTQAARVDGSVFFLSADLKPETLRALISIAGNDGALADAAD